MHLNRAEAESTAAPQFEQSNRKFENRVSSPALKVTPDGVMFFRRLGNADARAPFSVLDLREAYLPSVSFLANAPNLCDRPDLCMTLIRVVDNYLLQARETKSAHLSAICVARRLIKVFEYGWINGIYELSDWTRTASDELARKLIKGGWVYALDLVERARSEMEMPQNEGLSSIWTVSRSGAQSIVPTHVKKVLRTNIDTREIYSMRSWFAWLMAEHRYNLALLDQVIRNDQPGLTFSNEQINALDEAKAGASIVFQCFRREGVPKEIGDFTLSLTGHHPKPKPK